MVGFTTLVNQNTIDYTSTKVKSNHTNRLVLPGLPTSFWSHYCTMSHFNHFQQWWCILFQYARL